MPSELTDDEVMSAVMIVKDIEMMIAMSTEMMLIAKDTEVMTIAQCTVQRMLAA
jgi:hypothetical protein